MGVKTLYAEDISTLCLQLCESYPILTLTEEDHDVICEQIENFLDPFCQGWRNYN